MIDFYYGQMINGYILLSKALEILENIDNDANSLPINNKTCRFFLLAYPITVLSFIFLYERFIIAQCEMAMSILKPYWKQWHLSMVPATPSHSR